MCDRQHVRQTACRPDRHNVRQTRQHVRQTPCMTDTMKDIHHVGQTPCKTDAMKDRHLLRQTYKECITVNNPLLSEVTRALSPLDRGQRFLAFQHTSRNLAPGIPSIAAQPPPHERLDNVRPENTEAV